MIEPDKSNDDGKVLIMLILTHTVNYNPFTVSLLVPTSIIAVAYTFQLMAQVNMYSDPYTGKPLETYADKANYVGNRVVNICCMLFAITVHNYVI